MEPQLPDLTTQVPGVRLAEILGVLSKQADEEIDAAEVAVASQDRTSGSIPASYNPAMHPMLYASYAIAKQAVRFRRPCERPG